MYPEIEIGTELRVTRCENLVGENTDTTNRDGHYFTVENSFAVDLSRLLTNKMSAGEPFRPGETVDVEYKHGKYIGRFRLDQTQDDVANGCALIVLPPAPTVTTGGQNSIQKITLADQGDSAGAELPVTIEADTYWLWISPKGYGTHRVKMDMDRQSESKRTMVVCVLSCTPTSMTKTRKSLTWKMHERRTAKTTSNTRL